MKGIFVSGIDFDGTCVEHKYPDVGPDVPGAARVLKKLQAKGHELILWTMRSDRELNEAVAWFDKNGLALYGVNENPHQFSWTKSPKAYCHHYIDDAALGCPLRPSPAMGGRPIVDWDAVEKLLVDKGVL